MKYCPQCQTTYADDLLKFCLKDGTPLGEVFGAPPPNQTSGGEETVASIRRVEPIRVPVEQTPVEQIPAARIPVEQTPVEHTYVEPTVIEERPPVQTVRNAPAPDYRQPIEQPVAAAPPVARKSRTGSSVALTILGALLALGIVALGAALYFRNQKPEVAAANANKSVVNRAVNQNAANVSTASQTVNQNSNQNPSRNSSRNASGNINENSSAAAPAGSPTTAAAATPKAALDAGQSEIIADEVTGAINDWKNATEKLDTGAQLNQYAERVDYYRSRGVSRERVRADKERAFGNYNRVNIDISNLKITPGASGDNATAVFDKAWNFQGDERNSSGKVRQQLNFSKIGGKWLITGERDLKVYYVRS